MYKILQMKIIILFVRYLLLYNELWDKYFSLRDYYLTNEKNIDARVQKIHVQHMYKIETWYYTMSL